MTVLEAVNTHNEDRGVSPLPTLDEALFQQEVRRAEAWLDAMVASARSLSRCEVVTITPAVATVILQRNGTNRPLHEGTVRKYRRDMESGRWVFNGEAIIIGDDGQLLDGQHRLAAVAASGCAMRAVVVFGPSADARITIDQGKARSAGDYLGMLGFTDTSRVAAAAVHAWQWMNVGFLSPTATYRPNKSEVIDFVRAHPQIVKSVAQASTKNVGLVGGRSLIGFVHFALVVTTGDRAAATNFITMLIDGDGLTKNDPIIHARNRLFGARNRARANEKAEVIFRAWNQHRKGAEVTHLKVIGGDLPKLER